MVPRSVSDDHKILVVVQLCWPTQPINTFLLASVPSLWETLLEKKQIITCTPLNSLLPHHIALQAVCDHHHHLSLLLSCSCHPSPFTKAGSSLEQLLALLSACVRHRCTQNLHRSPHGHAVHQRINSFLWSFNLELPGGTGSPLTCSFHLTEWKGPPSPPQLRLSGPRSRDKASALTQSPLADVRPSGTANNELRVIH